LEGKGAGGKKVLLLRPSLSFVLARVGVWFFREKSERAHSVLARGNPLVQSRKIDLKGEGGDGDSRPGARKGEKKITAGKRKHVGYHPKKGEET